MRIQVLSRANHKAIIHNLESKFMNTHSTVILSIAHQKNIRLNELIFLVAVRYILNLTPNNSPSPMQIS
ncbi:hypothetical protein Hsar01_02595 [Haloferula sargassicola]|uniref:Uncharacterized protein n=1 Tax=Haloferula sargassicola TaxID=490096 RepID=A0ABP9UVJ9_9BACT